LSLALVRLVEEHIPIASEILNALALGFHRRLGAACLRIRAGWILLGLIALSLATTPVTQHLWNWDRFLHGGQDFETAVFLILVSFCLLTVLARSGRANLRHFFAALGALEFSRLFDPWRVTQCATCLASVIACNLSANGSHPPQAAFNLPLQI
jgi:hypothetical protein